MPDHPLRRILSRILTTEDASKFEVSYIHRGAASDTAFVTVSHISKVDKGSFTLEDGETQIPFHRILQVQRLQTGEILWQKRIVARARA